MTDKKILDDVWKQHRENKDSKHELRAHFCRGCLDLYAELYEAKVLEVIDTGKTPVCTGCCKYITTELGLGR